MTSDQGQIRSGSVIHIHYRLTVEGGIALESSTSPIRFTHGDNTVPAVMQQALLNKRAGDIVQLVLPAKDAFGEWSDALVASFSRGAFCHVEPLAIGMRVDTTDASGHPIVGLLKAFDETHVTVDLNHPLAGVQVTAHVRVISVEPRTVEQR